MSKRKLAKNPRWEDSEVARLLPTVLELPDDMQAAFEGFKLAILRHKYAGWAEISRDDVLRALDQLRQAAEAGWTTRD